MEQRQLQIQRLHRRIRQYQPTSQQLRHLERTHSQLQAAIELKYNTSKANATYRFPLSHNQQPSLHDVDPCGTVYNLHSQNPRTSSSKVRFVCSSLEQERNTSSLERDSLGSRNRKNQDAKCKVVKKGNGGAGKKLRTEGEMYNKENVGPFQKVSAPKKGKNSGNQSKLNTTEYNSRGKKPRKSESRKKQLRINLNDSADALLLSSKIYPVTTTSNKMKCNFTQSYQFQGLSKLADETKNNDKLSDYENYRLDTSMKKKKEQFPYEKMYNDLQMKLLTNRMSQQGKSVKSNYRLLLDGDTPTHHRQLHSRFTNR